MGSLVNRAVVTPCDRGLERERGESGPQRGKVRTKPRLHPKREAALFRHEKKGAGLALLWAFGEGRESAWMESTPCLLCLCRFARVTSIEFLAELILTLPLTQATDGSQEANERWLAWH